MTGAEDETPAEEQVPETTVQEGTINEGTEDVTEKAVQTAELAAQAASEKDAQLQQALQENAALKEQYNSLNETITQMSQQQKEAIVEEALDIPLFDVDSIAFEDDETKRARQEEYARKMAEFVKGGVMKEISPFVEQAKEGLAQKEKSEAINALSTLPELAGIGDMVPQLDRIITSNKALQSNDLTMEEKYITAYAIAKGVDSINTPATEAKDPTADELMQYYEKNPDFQDLIEKKRLEQAKEGQQVPPFSASSGAVNAALNIKEKPKTFDEASQRTREMFGL